MKKFFLLGILILSCANSFSQTHDILFNLQFDGSFKTPSGEDFVVINLPGKSQKELFDECKARAISKLEKLFRINEKLIQEEELVNEVIEGEAFTVNAYISKYNTVNNAMLRLNGKYWGASYTYRIKFKDGRVRIESARIINTFFEGESVKARLNSGMTINQYNKAWGGIKKDGKVNAENENYKKLNQRFTEEIYSILEGDTNSEDW